MTKTNGHLNGINGAVDISGSEYQVLEQWQGQAHHVKIIHVGMGASGMLAAYKAKKMLTNYELICYEK